MIRVGIIGATGYAGAELVRILCGHPDIELTVITSRQYAGVKFDTIYPSMRGVVNLIFLFAKNCLWIRFVTRLMLYLRHFPTGFP
jgi:N-acetyl-gamma-glutamyl-phosphate reductase